MSIQLALCLRVPVDVYDSSLKKTSNEFGNNHVAHCYADALLQIFAILAKQICK